MFDIPEPGAYAVRLLFFERGGGSELEFFAAEGSHSSFSGSFQLAGDTANGGLATSGIASMIGTTINTLKQLHNSLI